MRLPQALPDTVAKLRVPAGFVLVSCSPGSPAHIPIARPGLPFALWAIPARLGCRLSGKKPALATGGPYAYTRNPLYLAPCW